LGWPRVGEFGLAIRALAEQTLCACWDGEHWVIMLPSEY
jgi:hypothetical protein